MNTAEQFDFVRFFLQINTNNSNIFFYKQLINDIKNLTFDLVEKD